jgi:DnaJ-class molecular chaperone
MIEKVTMFRTGDGGLFDKRSEAIKHEYKDVFLCPACNGDGEITEEYNSIPFEQSCGGMVYKAAFRPVKCKTCLGDGYTRKKLKPVYKLEGYR